MSDLAQRRVQFCERMANLNSQGNGEIAILFVDVQNDFITGSLAVPGAADCLEGWKHWLQLAVDWGWHVYASLDSHPPTHCSFKEQGGPWPAHCVVGSKGAQLYDKIRWDYYRVYKFTKGVSPQQEQYSIFYEGSHIWSFLRDHGIGHLLICGLALDYCVRATALDAIKHCPTTVLLAQCAAVDTNNTARILQEFDEAGIEVFDENFASEEVSNLGYLSGRRMDSVDESSDEEQEDDSDSWDEDHSDEDSF